MSNIKQFTERNADICVCVCVDLLQRIVSCYTLILNDCKNMLYKINRRFRQVKLKLYLCLIN
jgi:hypothetical protein